MKEGEYRGTGDVERAVAVGCEKIGDMLYPTAGPYRARRGVYNDEYGYYDLVCRNSEQKGEQDRAIHTEKTGKWI